MKEKNATLSFSFHNYSVKVHKGEKKNYDFFPSFHSLNNMVEEGVNSPLSYVL